MGAARTRPRGVGGARAWCGAFGDAGAEAGERRPGAGTEQGKSGGEAGPHLRCRGTGRRGLVMRVGEEDEEGVRSGGEAGEV